MTGQPITRPFVYNANPGRVLFGRGQLAALPAEVSRLGAGKALILTTPEQRDAGERLTKLLGALAGGIFDGVVMHTPTEVTERAVEAVTACGCDCLVSIGGGSTIGLGKALALRTGLPQVAIPTTYAGSEMTPILGETSAGVKTTLRSPRVLPQVVIYDVDLTLSLPIAMSATSGLNAMAHAVEAVYAKEANPIISLMAEQGIAALARSLPMLTLRPADVAARSDAQYGAWLCGTCLGAVGMALHHKLCHVLGGTLNLPHAETHAIVLPYSLAYNAQAVPGAMRRISAALGTDQSASAFLHHMLRLLNVPTSLEAIGMPESGIEMAVELVLTDSYWNPRPMEREPLRRLLEAAFSGAAPSPL